MYLFYILSRTFQLLLCLKTRLAFLIILFHTGKFQGEMSIKLARLKYVLKKIVTS